MKNNEYPENREWKQKAFGMPKLPSGDIGQDKVLYYILKMVKDGKSANTMLNIEGSNSTATLGRMCEWIRPIGLVNKEKQVWTLTELGEMVLERQDSYFSTAVFCSTIVFMGEILFYLQEPKNSQELLKIAEEYHLNWKTNSEIHNRIKWFRDVDMVRFEEYKLEYSLTQKGQEFLQQIEVTMPSETEEEPDETLLETQLPMSEWASALKPATTEKKRMAIGYMLGNTWLEKQSPVDLIACLDARYLFVYELLAELRKEPKNAKTLSIIAKVSYGFDRESIEETRKRLILLSAAKLIYSVTNDKYGLTARGEKLLDTFGIVAKESIKSFEIKKEENAGDCYNDSCESLITELRLSSKDSYNPNRFEKAIRAAFDFIGYDATWLGGSGKTDVLIKARTAPKLSYAVAVDAKSTQSGNVTEDQIDFDTLKDHRKLHHADYSAIVGCSFRGERLLNRCKEHKVALIDVDTLEQLIRNQVEIPLTGEDYKKIFEQTGIVDISVLDEARNRTERYGLLVDAIVGCLVNESKDEVTEGILTSREIYRTVRDDERFSINPNLDEIEDILKFLASPLIGCVGKNKDGYYAIGSLNEVAKKFQFYAKSCKRTS